MNSTMRKIVFFLMLMAIAWFAYAHMIKPANASMALQREQINEKLTKLNQLEQLSGAAEDMGRQLSRLSEAVEFFQDRLPPENEIHKVLEQITLIAQKQGLDCGTITALKTKSRNGCVEQPLKMEISGDFYAFYSFLIEAEKLPRIIRIRELDIDTDSKKPAVIKVNMIISVFFSV